MRPLTTLSAVLALSLAGYIAAPAAPVFPVSGEGDLSRLATLKASAASGNPSALNALGSLYYDGRGVSRDLVKARRDYREAARKGSLSGARNFGWMLWKGEGGAPDFKRARRWLEVAARGGDPRAMNMLGAFDLSTEGGRDPGKAFRTFLRGARAGNREAMFNLGALYDRGAGVPQDVSRAAHWWRKSAHLGDTTAQTALGDLYERGQGVPRDYGKAAYWYAKAAKNGSPLARESLRVGPWSGALSLPPSSRAALPHPALSPGAPPSGGTSGAVGQKAVPVSASGSPAGGSPAAGERETRQELSLLRQEVESLVKARTQKPVSRFQTTVDRPVYRERLRPDFYAVVVGVESYPGGVPKAPFADRDARAVMRHFEALGVPPDHLRLLTDALATRGGIDASLRWLRHNASSRATVFFYYSGHGIPGGKGEPYLAPSGVMAGDLEDTAYPLSRLYRGLSSVGAARTLVFLDACFAGAGARSFSGPLRPVFVESPAHPERGLVVLSGVSGSQESGVFDAKGHGLFTYYLLKGLNGAALASNHVTLGSLFGYTREHVSSRAHLDDREQTPRLTSESPAEEGMRLR